MQTDDQSLMTMPGDRLHRMIALIGPIEAAFIKQPGATGGYTLGFRLESVERDIYLSTHRAPNAPRFFKTVEAALSVGCEFVPLADGVRQFEVTID